MVSGNGPENRPSTVDVTSANSKSDIKWSAITAATLWA